MTPAALPAARATLLATALAALLLAAGCSGRPHAAPAFPSAEAGEGQVELQWNAVDGAKTYVILWSDSTSGADTVNEIKDISETRYTHTGLTNFHTYTYRIVADSSGGRGPASLSVQATPGPVPGPVEWTAVVTAGNDQVVHFATAARATRYRVYVAAAAASLAGRRPNATYEETATSPLTRTAAGALTSLYYRVIAMNDTRIGVDGPVATSTAHTYATINLSPVAPALADPNADGCLDLASATGDCHGVLTARDMTAAGLSGLFAAGRANGDSRFADFNGDGKADLFSNTLSLATDAASRAVLHVNQGTGNFAADAGVTALGIGGFGGTVFTADFDHDGDVDLVAPHDGTRGDSARNWLLLNNGGAVFTDAAAAAGVATNPAGPAYVPRGGQAVDFNEDGRIDLLFGSRFLINNGNGTFSDGSAAANVPVRADQGMKLLDVDLDGDLDLIHHDGAVTRLYRNTAGVLDGGTVVDEDTTQATFGLGLNVCDVNSDGFEDVLIAHNVTATGTGIPHLLVNVNGQLMPSSLPNGFQAAGDLVAHNDLLACGDLDNNGVIDILARWGTTYRELRASSSIEAVIRLRVLGSGGERNQQGRIVRLVPQSMPNRRMTRVIESGSGLQSQNQYDLLIGAPWPGTYDVTVRFGNGTVATTAKPGDSLTIYEDGRVVTGLH